MCNGRRHTQLVQTKKKLSGKKMQLCYNVVVRINLAPAPDPG